ncbi:MAG: T9SS type A sorting domain-containing protein [Bacteroidia bacterium]
MKLTLFDPQFDPQKAAEIPLTGNVIETYDSCFVFLCKLGIPSTFNQAPSMIKIDRDGNEIWRHRQDTLVGNPYYIRQTPDSGFIVAGGAATANNSYYAKYRPDGNMQWIKYPFGLSSDTVPNDPSVLRVHKNGTFDVYYETYYQIPSGLNVGGLFKHYDLQGNCLSTKEYFDPYLTFFSCDNSDSAIWAVSVNGILYAMGSDSTFKRRAGLNGIDTTMKFPYWYIETSDNGYLGVGQYSYDFTNVDPQFYLVKFGDNRYNAEDFSESVNAYPNPSADGNVTLTFDMKTDNNVQVSILTTEGKLLYSSEIFCPANSHTELPVRLNENSVNAGMYILEAITSDAVIRKKIIVSREH